MPKPSVYIETTVISYLVARPSRDIVVAAHHHITREWWELALPKLRPHISQVVIDEISRGDKDAARRRLAAVASFNMVEITSDAAVLAERYCAVLSIPRKAVNDAYHLAAATLSGMEYLVSWNCTHIASARTRSLVDFINAERGFETPVICTPEELMEV